MFYVYILENLKGILYIGYTSNIEIRLAWHNSGKSKFTKNKGPWKFIYKQEFQEKSDALKYENYLKSLKNPKYIREHIIK